MELGFMAIAFLLGALLDQINTRMDHEDHLIFGFSYFVVVFFLTMFMPVVEGSAMSIMDLFSGSLITGFTASMMYFVGVIPSKLADMF